MNFLYLSLALHLEKDEGERIKKGKIIFSAVGPGPVVAAEAEKILKGVSLDKQTIEKIASQAIKEISPMRTSIYSPAYKRKMAGILLRQGLEQLRDAE